MKERKDKGRKDRRKEGRKEGREGKGREGKLHATSGVLHQIIELQAM